jgi:four helix bundle protein
MSLKSYRKLKVWQRGMDLVEEIYRLSKIFPSEERFGLISQIRRAAVSVPANIAEGYGRTHTGDYLRHLSISNGSLMEVETHLIISGRLEYIGTDQAGKAWDLIREISRMLSALIKSLNP